MNERSTCVAPCASFRAREEKMYLVVELSVPDVLRLNRSHVVKRETGKGEKEKKVVG